jgi:hypothetical protein
LSLIGLGLIGWNQTLGVSDQDQSAESSPEIP